MKVRELIKDTVWLPGSDYKTTRKPALSVLLPTFRRGKNGLFRKAVLSVLDQSLEDIELIIVDDGSTDGTADQIAEFMKEDGRISCLRHPFNIGLPAISEYEAFLRARADHIAFAFDDIVFNLDALEKLLSISQKNPGKVCFGSVFQREYDARLEAVRQHRVGSALSPSTLRSWNSIPNCAVMLSRDIFKTGLYDPHILMTRVCDWDLWRRLSENHIFQHFDVDIGEVAVFVTDHSISTTHTLSFDASEERMRTMRSLTLDAFADADIFEDNPNFSARTSALIADLKTKYLRERPALRGQSVESKSSNRDKIIYILTPTHDSSTTLCFDYLPLSYRGRVRVIRSIDAMVSISEIASASCIIVIRHIAAAKLWMETAEKFKIPIYYFIDDNLPDLVTYEGLRFDSSEDFEIHRFRMIMRRFAGVLVSSLNLVEYFKANLLHSNVFYFPVSYAERPLQLPERHDSPEIVIASIGGRHRQKGLQDRVMPALRAIASPECPIHFVLAGCSLAEIEEARDVPDVNEYLRTTMLPAESDWKRTLMQVAQYRPHIMVHAPSKTLNNKYKTLNVALGAFLIDSVLVVPNDPPYDLEEFEGCAVNVSPATEPRAWFNAIQGLISDKDAWESYIKQNAAFCRQQFSGEQNIVVLEMMSDEAPPINTSVVESRLRELYLGATNVSAPLSSVNTETLHDSFIQLARLRARWNAIRRLIPRWRRPDIWPAVSPAFEDIKRYALARTIKRKGTLLEVSPSISDVLFVEYRMKFEAGALKSMTCSFASDGFHEGEIGIELVDPNNTIACHTTLDLSRLNFHLPVRFEVGDVVIKTPELWRVRLFARSRWPIYVYEFAEYSWFGLKRRTVAPFASFEYATSDVAQDPQTRSATRKRSAIAAA